MSNLEHLIENTLVRMEEGKTNIEQLIKTDENYWQVDINSHDILEICSYFYYTYLPDAKEKWEKECCEESH